MHKLEFFSKAVKSNAFKNKGWMISAFSITNENKDEWLKNPYVYRIVQTPAGAFFVDPDNTAGPNPINLTPIEGFATGSPIFTAKDRIVLKAGDFVNLTEDIESTVGNVLFNCICLIQAFGNKIPFINKSVNLGEIEDYVASNLNDTPAAGAIREDKKLYVDEYIKFVDALFWMTNFTQLFVWGATEKVLTPPPGIVEFKNQLLEKYKGRLSDPTVLAEIDDQLIKFDSEYLKGDPGENFLLSAKSRKIVRKRKFLMYGGEAGLDDTTSIDPITTSLYEGWDLNKFPTMNNALRAGTYNRGAQTELGGESVKWLMRASSNIVVTTDDCGSLIGKPMDVTKDNSKKLIDFTVLIDGEKHFVENQEQAEKYIGQSLMVRSPMYCKLDKTDYCKVCVGRKLGENPTGLSMTISEYGSAFLNLFMKAMHGKSLDTVKLNVKASIN